MQLSVNGASRELAEGATLADLLVALELRSEVVAIERNHELVPRERHAETALDEGDRVEIVTLVGGG